MVWKHGEAVWPLLTLMSMLSVTTSTLHVFLLFSLAFPPKRILIYCAEVCEYFLQHFRLHHLPQISRKWGLIVILIFHCLNLKQKRRRVHKHTLIMTQHCVFTVGFECSEERGEQGAADADVHQLGQGVQSQLRGEVIEERVWVLSLVLLHQLD